MEKEVESRNRIRVRQAGVDAERPTSPGPWREGSVEGDCLDPANRKKTDSHANEREQQTSDDDRGGQGDGTYPKQGEGESEDDQSARSGLDFGLDGGGGTSHFPRSLLDRHAVAQLREQQAQSRAAGRGILAVESSVLSRDAVKHGGNEGALGIVGIDGFVSFHPG